MHSLHCVSFNYLCSSTVVFRAKALKFNKHRIATVQMKKPTSFTIVSLNAFDSYAHFAYLTDINEKANRNNFINYEPSYKILKRKMRLLLINKNDLIEK